jgi:hypothetical protein
MLEFYIQVPEFRDFNFSLILGLILGLILDLILTFAHRAQ